MKIRAVIIDDEPLAREGIKNYIKQLDFIELVAAFSNPIQAIKKLDSDKIDLIFLDIHMPKLSGLDFLKVLTAPPVVIITTAYPNYALEGFELDVMDYLLKPISFEKFLKAANKAKDYIELKRAAGNKINAGNEFFFIKCGNKYEKINYDDILYVEAMQNYVVVNSFKKKHIAYITLKSLFENLPKEKFVRAQKSFVVAVSKIDSIEGNTIRIGEHSISISRDNKENVMKLIMNGKIIKR